MSTKEKSVVKSDEKKSVFDDVQVRVSPDEAEYMPLRNKDGWLIAVGRPRAPEVSKATRLFLAAAIKRRCALFATNGGIRVMMSAAGDHGVCFIEHNQMTKGEEVFLFTGDRKKIESLGIKVVREQKSFYVSMKANDGESSFSTIYENFGNNRSPRGWVAHRWPGHEVIIKKKINTVTKASPVAEQNIVKKPESKKKVSEASKIVPLVAKKNAEKADSTSEKKKRPKEVIAVSA